MGHLVFAVLTTCLISVASAAFAYGVKSQRLEHVEQIAIAAARKAELVHEIREDQREIKTDIKWMKERLR